MRRVKHAGARAALLVGAAAVGGVLVRVHVTALFARVVGGGGGGGGALPLSLAGNLLGSFALGALHASGAYAPPCVQAGLSAGFAGSLTTFATAMFHAAALLVRGRAARAVTSLLLTVLASAGAYVAGADLFSLLDWSLQPAPMGEVGATLLSAAVCAAAWGAVIIASVVDTLPFRRQGWLAAAFAPPGAVLRWILSKLNKGDFPRGTFLANTAACGVDSILAALMYRGVGGSGGSLWFMALFTGFAGSLSTISTFVSELRELSSGRRLAYAAISVSVALQCFLCIYGVVVWVS